MNRFWVSWEEPEEDYRPMTDPPNRAVIAWWCSGSAGDGSYSTLVALVEAVDEAAAMLAIARDWPMGPSERAGRRWRFCNAVGFDWTPGPRFPMEKPWERERFAGRIEAGA